MFVDAILPKQAEGLVFGFYTENDPDFQTELRSVTDQPVRVPGRLRDLPGRAGQLYVRQPNTMLYEWGTIVQKLLRNPGDGKKYEISGMYLEFDNSGSPVNPTPTISRDGALSYYNSLSAPRDYLRIPLVATAEESSDATLYPKNNTAVFIGQSQGTLGFKNGLAFSDVAGSRIYGGALVSMPGGNDDSQDLVLSRFYFAAANQMEKLAGSEINILWKVKLL